MILKLRDFFDGDVFVENVTTEFEGGIVKGVADLVFGRSKEAIEVSFVADVRHKNSGVKVGEIAFTDIKDQDFFIQSYDESFTVSRHASVEMVMARIDETFLKQRVINMIEI